MEENIFPLVEREHYFIVSDGSEIRNLSELADGLHKMEDTTYRHHANEYKNDFYSWISMIYNDERLANLLLHSVSREEAKINVDNRLNEMRELAYELQKPKLTILDPRLVDTLTTKISFNRGYPKLALSRLTTNISFNRSFPKIALLSDDEKRELGRKERDKMERRKALLDAIRDEKKALKTKMLKKPVVRKEKREHITPKLEIEVEGPEDTYIPKKAISNKNVLDEMRDLFNL